MLKNTISTQFISVFIAVVTFVGIALHDTKVDTMTTMAIAISIPVLAAYESAHIVNLNSSDGSHTHVEKVSVANTMKQHTSSAPALQAGRDDRKYRSQKNAPKGHHFFDNYNLPLAA